MKKIIMPDNVNRDLKAELIQSIREYSSTVRELKQESTKCFVIRNYILNQG